MAIDPYILMRGQAQDNENQRVQAELPGIRADSDRARAMAQQEQRVVEGQQAIKDASVEHTKINEDGSVTIDYPGLAAGLARRGFGDLAQGITKNHLELVGAGIKNAKDKTEASKARDAFERAAKQHFASGLEMAPPEKRAEVVVRGIEHFAKDFGIDVPLETFADANGQYDPAKVDSFIKSSKAASQTVQEAATTKATLGNLELGGRAQSVNEITNVATPDAKNPNSAVSVAARNAAIANGATPESVNGLSAAQIQNNPALATTQAANAPQIPLSGTDKSSFLKLAAAESAKLNTIGGAISLLNKISKKGSNAGTSIQQYRMYTPADWNRLIGNQDYTAALGVLDRLKNEHGLELDLANGPDAAIRVLKNAAHDAELNIKRATKSANSKTAGEAATGVQETMQPIVEEVDTPPPSKTKPKWAN